jgi:ferredoxin--NADP+ reductase
MPNANAPESTEIPGIPEMPEIAQHLVKPISPVIGRVHATRLCTRSRKASGFVRHVEIDVSGTALENSWHAGQSFGVIPAGDAGDGKAHKLRLYSIAAPTGGETGDGTIITTTVKRLVDEHWDTHKLVTGVCSNYLCDLNVGDEVLLSGPVGKRFLLPTNPANHDYIFIATGTGIAPFRGMMLDLIRQGLPSRVALLMGTPYESDLLYDDDLTGWAQQYENFTYHTAISRHTTPTQPTKLYVQDRLREDFGVLAPMLASDRTLIYICGLAGMELGVFQTLAKLLPADQLAQYLTLPEGMAEQADQWERSMIPKTIKKTKRVFLEVY